VVVTAYSVGVKSKSRLGGGGGDGVWWINVDRS
jgi:hypothetical protein